MTDPAMKPRTCPRCRAPIPPQASEAMCPACLLSQAIGSPDDETLDQGAPRSPAALGDESLPANLGPYRLLRLLGRGGMGTVYEAQHRPTGRRVALKRLDRRLDSPEMRRRFLREGRLAASVSHPNSLYVFGSEDVDGTPVITMEIAEGGTLQDELVRRGPLPVPEAVDAVLDVVAGLEAAQGVGVLHRDVKPSNCFLTPDGSVKVGDYGLSISTLGSDDTYATAAGTVMGTPAYAAPEQLRGDDLDPRADLYSVGATLFSLLTGEAPFDGRNAVQVVANAVHLSPKSLGGLREGVPVELERIVSRCLAKDPGDRFTGYGALRDALLPFSSQKRRPASMEVRSSAGWIDFLLAFFVPYAVLMLAVGGPTFHFRWLLERTPASAVYYGLFLTSGLLYFTVAEGFWGAGLGKRLKGLRVVRADGQRPGPLRALVRIAAPILSIEAVRLPLVFATIDATRIDAIWPRGALIYTGAALICPWIPFALDAAARRLGSPPLWDLLSGTEVVLAPPVEDRPRVEEVAPPVEASPSGEPPWLGPFRVEGVVEPGRWLTATDPVLNRPVWLLRRQGDGPSEARRGTSRSGRPRWLQGVEGPDGSWWDAYGGSPGAPLRARLATAGGTAWSDLRHWLHDLAHELWSASPEGTLPPQLGLDHVWLTSSGRAVILDVPWPSGKAPAKVFGVEDLAGKQRFLHALAAEVETTGTPLDARPVLENLSQGRFEKLSFLVGVLQSLRDRPAALSRRARAGALLLLPAYSLVMSLLGSIAGAENTGPLVSGYFGSLPFFVLIVVVAICGVTQLVLVPFRITVGHRLFRLSVIDATGRSASRRRRLVRWGFAWLPLIVAFASTVWAEQGLASIWPRLWLGLWLGLVFQTALDPQRGLHDRLAGTWVVRR
ncbi:MAG: protein kinase [Acidobacteriota bacterium]